MTYEENKKAYNAIICWVENPSIKNFFKLYKDGFLSVLSGGVRYGEFGALFTTL